MAQNAESVENLTILQPSVNQRLVNQEYFILKKMRQTQIMTILYNTIYNTVTHHIGALNTKTSRKNMIPKQLFASMKVNDKVNIKFPLDCGATCNTLPLKQYIQAMGNPENIYLQKSNAILTMYNGTVIHPIGKCKLTCTRSNSKHLLEFQVVDGDVKPLLSAETCQKLKFLQVLVNDKQDKEEMVQDKLSVNTTSDIFQEYADVFEGIRCLDESYHIEIDPTVKPVIHPPLRVPVTLKDLLKKELDRMVAEGILTPVNEATDWVSSKVTVVKPNKLRICIDPKDLNRAIRSRGGSRGYRAYLMIRSDFADICFMR